MSDCLFCIMVDGDIPITKVFENEHVLAFRDISPQAPVHILVIPKQHIVSAADITAENSALVAKCFEAIPEIARAEGLDNGFRVITNSGTDGGQTVAHLHFHILGGRGMGEALV